MSTDSELRAPAALVTGATSGIGREAALTLATDGFTVIVHGRDADRGAAAAREITRAGGRARFVSADLPAPARSGGWRSRPARWTCW